MQPPDKCGYDFFTLDDLGVPEEHSVATPLEYEPCLQGTLLVRPLLSYANGNSDWKMTLFSGLDIFGWTCSKIRKRDGTWIQCAEAHSPSNLDEGQNVDFLEGEGEGVIEP